jgi:hypothetical protein
VALYSIGEVVDIWQWTYYTSMAVNAGDSLVGIGFLQLGCDNLLDGQDDAVLAPDAD